MCRMRGPPVLLLHLLVLLCRRWEALRVVEVGAQRAGVRLGWQRWRPRGTDQISISVATKTSRKINILSRQEPRQQQVEVYRLQRVV